MVFEKICEILSEQLDINENNITMESSLAEDLGADSLDIMEMAMAIGDEYDIEIDEEQLDNIKTVGDAVRYVESVVND